MIETTILFPNYNNAYVLPRTFDALRRNIDCSKVNLVVVDDGSEDGGVSVIKRELVNSGFHHSEVIERKHEGIVNALNVGLNAVKTPFVVRIDGDAIVNTSNWIERMQCMLRNPQVGMVGGHTILDTGVLHSMGRHIIGENGLYDMGTFPLEGIGKRTLDSNVWRPWKWFEDGPLYESDAVLATCIGFRLDDALAFGGFDAMFNPVWIEDDDFGISMRKLGLKVLVDPCIRIYHCVSLRGSRQPGVENRKISRQGFNSSSWKVKMDKLRKLVHHNFHPLPVDFDATRGRTCLGANDWRRAILTEHYRSWKGKWGFDPLNPDMGFIFENYYDTEICWRYNPATYKSGQKLLADLQAEL